jgi:hydroxyacylglutathione hydrolase
MYLCDDTPPVLFSGDTLFVGGCGRFFEGSAADMLAITERVKELPPATELYCGHEYTVSNLRFALSVEPENEALKAKMAWATAQREEGKHTIPSTLAEEFAYNPFMRVEALAGVMGVGSNPVDIMAAVREAKNNF